MIIKEIEFENFRQFKDHGLIKCSSDGKMTIIYGKNGDGKTTLHQLFHWIFYNSVNFNKTTTDKLYNLTYETSLKFNDTTDTEGRIVFEHKGSEYQIRRVWHYQKQISRISKIGEEVELFKLNENNDWGKLTQKQSDVTNIIEEILPFGLSEYFFFDGESMIADLKVKSSVSAKKLKEALFTIFDLEYLDRGIKHIGEADKVSTAIGTLYKSKGDSSSNADVLKANEHRINAEKRVEELREEIERRDINFKLNEKRMAEISEEIGSALSNDDYEKRRKKIKSLIDSSIKDIADEKLKFGNDVYEIYPKLLVKKRFDYAKQFIKDKLEKEEKNLPHGLDKELITTLLSSDSKTCICGNHIGEAERRKLASYLLLFPPYSYNHLFYRLDNMIKSVGRNNFDDAIFYKHFETIFEKREHIQEFEAEIKELDDEKQKNKGLQDLVLERIKLEEENDEIRHQISDLYSKKGVAETVHKQQKRKYDDLVKNEKTNKSIDEKIYLLESVKRMLVEELDRNSVIYSRQLKYNIEYLLENMLTSKREVDVNKDFYVRVYDSFGDESKSEGQFAVVSFAYIGAILKLLKEEEALRNKEYPLVLDGPFSKLDEDQRQNVIDVIPKFAPQIILFSKDDLSEYIDENMIGNIWTIRSNEEKNLSYFEEGFLWD